MTESSAITKRRRPRDPMQIRPTDAELEAVIRRAEKARKLPEIDHPEDVYRDIIWLVGEIQQLKGVLAAWRP